MSTTTTSTETLVDQLHQLQIVGKVAQLALVSQALGYANQSYAKWKSSGGLVGTTIQQAEKRLLVVVDQVAKLPAVHQLDQPIHLADNLACTGFDTLQSKLTVLTKSSDEVSRSWSPSSVSHTLTASLTTVDSQIRSRTRSLVDNTRGRILEVKQHTLEKVNSVLSISDSLVASLDNTLNAAENAFDYLLPGNNQKEEANQSNKVPNGSDPAAPKSVKRLISRMGAFSDKVRRRLVEHARQKWIPALVDSVIVLRTSFPILGSLPLPLNGITMSNNSKTTSNATVSAQESSPSSSVEASSSPSNGEAKTGSGKKSKKQKQQQNHPETEATTPSA